MSFAALITTLTQAIVRGDGAAAAACFTADGVYHDVFYGAFPRAQIPLMVAERFHRDASDFRWDIHDPVSDGRIGYARYVFSYTGRVAGSEGRRALFEGVAVCHLDGALLSRYSEVAATATGLAMLGFAPERLQRIALRQADALLARAETLDHGGR